MSGVVGNLFGSKGARAESNTPTAFASLPQFAQDAFKQGVTRAQGISQDPSMFSPVPLNADQLKAFDMVREGYTPIDANSFGSMLSVFQNPFEQDVINPLISDIRTEGRGLLSDVGSGATAAGGFGGTRQAALEGDVMGRVLDTIAQQTGQLRSDNYQQAADRALASIGANNMLKGQQQTELSSLGDYLSSRDTATKQAPLEAINYLLSAAQGVPYGGGGTSLGAQADAGFLGRLSQIAANFGQLIPK